MANATNSVSVVQSVWSRGITDSLIQGRSDTDILSKGAQIIDNLIMLEQGGLKKRPGINTILGAVTPVQPGSLVQGFNLPFNETIIIVWGSNNTYIYNITTNAFTIVNFRGATSAVQDGNVILVSNGSVWCTITFNQSAQPILSSPITPTMPYTPFTVQSQQLLLLKIQGASINDYFYDGETIYVVFPTGGPANFYFLYANGLYLKFLSHTIISHTQNGFVCTVLNGSSFNVKASKTFPLGSPADNYYGIDTNTDASLLTYASWSPSPSLGVTTMPKYLAQFQNRLWCSNIDKVDDVIPINSDNKTIWVSAIGDKYNFLAYNSEPDSPLSVILAGDVNPSINNLTGGATISAFTDSGVYSFINQTNSSITPTNFFIQKQNSHAADPINAVEYDQKLYYIQSNRVNVRSLTYNASDSIQSDVNTTILSSELIRNPISICQVSSLDNTDDAYLFVLCKDDTGKSYIACHQSLQSQNIYGWTRWTFPYGVNISALLSVNNRLLAFVESDICEFKFSNKADFSVQPIKCKMRTNLYSMRDIKIGDLLFKRKKISKINVLVYNTDSVIINGSRHDVNHFDSEYSLTKTSIIEVNSAINWAKFDSVTIEHESENDFTLLSLGAELVI